MLRSYIRFIIDEAVNKTSDLKLNEQYDKAVFQTAVHIKLGDWHTLLPENILKQPQTKLKSPIIRCVWEHFRICLSPAIPFTRLQNAHDFVKAITTKDAVF